MEGLQFSYIASPNVGMDEEVLKLRMEKEAQSLSSWAAKTSSLLTSRPALLLWLFTDHGAYAAAPFFGASTPAAAASTSDVVKSSY